MKKFLLSGIILIIIISIAGITFATTCNYIPRVGVEEKKEITQSNNNDNIDYLKQNNVDIDKSLELLGDINTYNDLLKEFMATIKDKVNNLYRYKNNNDLVNYAILVHSLKSDSRYLGFTKLADIALNHELKSEENDLTYINNNFNLLLNEVREVINIANKYLN